MAQLSKPAPVPAQPGVKPAVSSDAGKPAQPLVSKSNKPKTNWKVMLIVGVFIFFTGTMIAAGIYSRTQQAGGSGGGDDTDRPPPIVPTATPIPRITIPPFPLGEETIYANDPQILELIGAIKNYERQMDNIDLREQDLDPPNLMMSVRF